MEEIDWKAEYTKAVNNVDRLNAERERLELENRELLMALDRAHDSGRCPYNSYGRCWACVALKKYGDKMPDQHLAVCSVCKKLIEDTFSARKAAWCEKCEGYSHNNCWAAHNLTYCTEKRKDEPECDCFVPALEGAGQHSPACAIFKNRG